MIKTPSIMKISTTDYFPDKSMDELKAALELAEKYETRIREIFEELEDIRAFLGRIDSTIRYRSSKIPKHEIVPCKECEFYKSCDVIKLICSCKSPMEIYKRVTECSMVEVIDARVEDDGRLFVKLSEPYPYCFRRGAIRSNFDQFFEKDDYSRLAYSKNETGSDSCGCSRNSECCGRCKI